MIYGSLIGTVRHGGPILWNGDAGIGATGVPVLLYTVRMLLSEHGIEWLHGIRHSIFFSMNVQKTEAY